MKRLLSAFVAVCMLLWPAAVPARTPPGVLIVGQTDEPKSLDPQAVTALNDFRILGNVFEGLVRLRAGTLQVEPALARRWQVGDGGRSYTFELRRGVRFHDGTPFDAEAVRFNFERMLDPDNPYHDTGPFPLAFFFSAIRGIDVIDRYTVRFRLDEPYAPFLSNLAYPTGMIVSPASVRRYRREVGRHPVGTGPFRFSRWTPNVRVELVRNDDYWRAPPALRVVEFRPLTDPNTRIAEMLAGGIDVMLEPPPDSLALFRDDPRFAVDEQAGPHLWFLILDTRHGPFAKRAVRQAANYAIDKQALVRDVLQGSAEIAAGPIPRAFGWAYDPSVAPYPYDPARAKALLKAAGYRGEPIAFAVTEGGSGMLDPIPMATAIQADLRAVGIDARIRSYEWNAYLARVNAGLDGFADMAEMAWMTNDPDTLPYLALRTDAQPAKGGFNSGYYSNPEVDALLEAARHATDAAQRASIYRRIQAIVHDDAPWVFVASWKQGIVGSARVHGLALQPSFMLSLYPVSTR